MSAAREFFCAFSSTGKRRDGCCGWHTHCALVPFWGQTSYSIPTAAVPATAGSRSLAALKGSAGSRSSFRAWVKASAQLRRGAAMVHGAVVGHREGGCGSTCWRGAAQALCQCHRARPSRCATPFLPFMGAWRAPFTLCAARNTRPGAAVGSCPCSTCCRDPLSIHLKLQMQSSDLEFHSSAQD